MGPSWSAQPAVVFVPGGRAGGCGVIAAAIWRWRPRVRCRYWWGEVAEGVADEERALVSAPRSRQCRTAAMSSRRRSLARPRLGEDGGLSIAGASRTGGGGQVGHAGEAIMALARSAPQAASMQPGSGGGRPGRSCPARWEQCFEAADSFRLVGFYGQGGALVGSVVSVHDFGRRRGVLGGAVAVAPSAGCRPRRPGSRRGLATCYVEGVAAGAGADDGVAGVAGAPWAAWTVEAYSSCTCSAT